MSHAEPHVGPHEVPYLGHPPTMRHLPRAPEWTAHAKQGGPFLFSLGECPVGHLHWVDDVNVYLSATVHFEGGGLAVCNLLPSRGR